MSDAAAGLLRALARPRRRRVAIGFCLSMSRSTEWQSLTFIGERHQMCFRVAGPDADVIVAQLVRRPRRCRVFDSRADRRRHCDCLGPRAANRRLDQPRARSADDRRMTYRNERRSSANASCSACGRVGRCALCTRSIEMPIDPGFELARRRHRRGVEQPHDPRISSPSSARMSSSTSSFVVA